MTEGRTGLHRFFVLHTEVQWIEDADREHLEEEMEVEVRFADYDFMANLRLDSRGQSG